MFKYEKILEYPINVKKKDLRMAKLLMTQFGGPDGELSAALRYLSQRFRKKKKKGKALLSDIGVEELGHVEMISTMINQLLKNATLEELKKEFRAMMEERRNKYSRKVTTDKLSIYMV